MKIRRNSECQCEREELRLGGDKHELKRPLQNCPVPSAGEQQHPSRELPRAVFNHSSLGTIQGSAVKPLAWLGLVRPHCWRHPQRCSASAPSARVFLQPQHTSIPHTRQGQPLVQRLKPSFAHSHKDLLEREWAQPVPDGLHNRGRWVL